MRSVLLVALLLTLSPGLRADVLTVGPSGDFAQIQDAVDVALDGDIVLVSSGTYAPVTVVGTALTVVADTGAAVVIDGGVTVTSLPAGATLSLVGLTVIMKDASLPAAALERPALLFGGNSGSLRVDGCAIAGSGSLGGIFGEQAFEVALIQGCADVAFARCTLTGGEDLPQAFALEPSAPGVAVIASTVAFHDCTVSGALGAKASSTSATDGGPGLAITSGTVFLSGTTVSGGRGGSGTADCVLDVGGWPGANGGAGAALLGPAARLLRLDSPLLGGAAGPGGVDAPIIFCFGTPDGQPGPDSDVQAGQLLDLAGAAHGMTLPSPARELQPLTLTLAGQPGELAGTFWGLGTSSFFKLGLRGQVLLDFGQFTSLIIVGNVPSGGELAVPFAFDDLGPGFEGLTIHFQSIFGGVDGTYLGAPVAAVIIDETL